MSNVLLRIDSGIRWLQALIEPGQNGLTCQLHFDVSGQRFTVELDNVPDSIFLGTLFHVRCLAIIELSFEERGWLESGRFQVRLNDDDDPDAPEAKVLADHVDWGPLDRSEVAAS